MGRIVLDQVTKKFEHVEVIPPLDLTIEDEESTYTFEQFEFRSSNARCPIDSVDIVSVTTDRDSQLVYSIGLTD